MGVLKPLKVIIDNYPDDQVDELEAVNNPEDASAGTRKIPFGKVLYIDQDDFRETPPPKYYRLSPGREVRLRYAYFVTCTSLVKDAQGNAVEVHCTYDPATRGGDSPDGRKVKATIHWVSAVHALQAEVRLYDRLFTKEDPEDSGDDFVDNLNPRSLEVLSNCFVEHSLKAAGVGDHYQFERTGYFVVDPDSAPDHLVFNRTVSLKSDYQVK
jgi:glutaminyl-tRNA synthetase